MTVENDKVPEIDLDALLPESGVEPVVEPVAPVTPEPDPTPTPAPQFTEEIEQLKAGYEEKLAQATSVLEATTARMNTLEQLVNQGFQQAHTPEPEPEVKFTQEDLQKDPLGTLERVSDAKVNLAVKKNSEQVTQVIGALVERSHQAELKSLEGKKYYAQVKDKVAEVFQANPQLKMQPNSAQRAYNMVVGEQIETLTAGEAVQPSPVTARTPLPTLIGGAPAAPVAPETTPEPEELELTPAQKRLQAKFAAMGEGLELTAKDFD